jgi:hypothetical protein
MLSGMASEPQIAAAESTLCLDQLQAELALPDFPLADHLARPAPADKRCDGCASCGCGGAAADPGA